MGLKNSIDDIYHSIDGLKDELQEVDRLLRSGDGELEETLDELKEIFKIRYKKITNALKIIEKET